jgi:hypothetical protein
MTTKMIRIDEDIYEKIKQLAETEQRSITNMANFLLKQALKD